LDLNYIKKDALLKNIIYWLNKIITYFVWQVLFTHEQIHPLTLTQGSLYVLAHSAFTHPAPQVPIQSEFWSQESWALVVVVAWVHPNIIKLAIKKITAKIN